MAKREKVGYKKWAAETDRRWGGLCKWIIYCAKCERSIVVKGKINKNLDVLLPILKTNLGECGAGAPFNSLTFSSLLSVSLNV